MLCLILISLFILSIFAETFEIRRLKTTWTPKEKEKSKLPIAAHVTVCHKKHSNGLHVV